MAAMQASARSEAVRSVKRGLMPSWSSEATVMPKRNTAAKPMADEASTDFSVRQTARAATTARRWCLPRANGARASRAA